MLRDEVLTKLSDYVGLKEEIGDKQFRADSGLLMYGEGMQMTPSGLKAASKWIGASEKFMEDVPVDLQATIFNRLFPTELPPKVITKEDAVLAFVEQKSMILDPEQLITKIESKFKIDGYDRLSPTKDGFELYLTSEVVDEKRQAVVVGDVIKGGAYIDFSPMGIYTPSVVSYAQRLACTNGAVRVDNLMRYSFRDGDAYEWIAEMADVSQRNVVKEVERYRRMRELPLNGNTVSVLNHLLENVPKAYHDLIHDLVHARHPGNVYEMMNIITEVATHRIENPRHVFAMMGAASNLSEDMEFCDNCHQVIAVV